MVFGDFWKRYNFNTVINTVNSQIYSATVKMTVETEEETQVQFRRNVDGIIGWCIFLAVPFLHEQKGQTRLTIITTKTGRPVRQPFSVVFVAFGDIETHSIFFAMFKLLATVANARFNHPHGLKHGTKWTPKTATFSSQSALSVTPRSNKPIQQSIKASMNAFISLVRQHQSKESKNDSSVDGTTVTTTAAPSPLSALMVNPLPWYPDINPLPVFLTVFFLSLLL